MVRNKIVNREELLKLQDEIIGPLFEQSHHFVTGSCSGTIPCKYSPTDGDGQAVADSMRQAVA